MRLGPRHHVDLVRGGRTDSEPGVSNGLRSTLVGWSKALSREVAADGVTCNVIPPGGSPQDGSDSWTRKKADREGRQLQEVIDEPTASIPVGRYGDPSERGAVTACLASQQASFVNGSVVRVDAGRIPSI